MEERPLLSIIIPVFNSEDVLTRTLKSLNKQSLGEAEVIFVNDGSTDGSLGLLRDFAKHSPGLRYITTENRGAFLAREEGIKQARGEYIGFCDAGDEVSSDGFNKMMSAAISTGADMAVGAFRRINNGMTGKLEANSFGDSVHPVNPNSGWLATINTALWNKIFRAEVLEHRLSLERPPRVMEDALFLYSLYPFMSSVAFVSESVYRYHVDAYSAMSHISTREISGLIEAWSTVRARIAEDNREFLPIVDLGAFIHLGISAPLHLERDPRYDFKDGLHVIRDALSGRFPLHDNKQFTSRAYVKRWPTMKPIRLASLCESVGILPAALGLYRLLQKSPGSSPTWR